MLSFQYSGPVVRTLLVWMLSPHPSLHLTDSVLRRWWQVAQVLAPNHSCIPNSPSPSSFCLWGSGFGAGGWGKWTSRKNSYASMLLFCLSNEWIIKCIHALIFFKRWTCEAYKAFPKMNAFFCSQLKDSSLATLIPHSFLMSMGRWGEGGREREAEKERILSSVSLSKCPQHLGQEPRI